jgi:hypothetical protein
LVVLLLAFASATGWAQSGQGSMDATTRAWNASTGAEQTLIRVRKTWNEINGKFRIELDAVARLKNSPKSWRIDRELRSKIADADALGRQLETASAEVRRATEQLVAARRTLIAAIDAELAGNPGTTRKTQLDRARAQVAPSTRKATRIVLPDMQIDPLADPEELDQQAKAIRDAEAELTNQLKGLEAQAVELERIAVLRKQHERSYEVANRDNDSARKGATPSATRQGGTTSSDDETGPASPPPNDPTGGRPDVSSFEMDATITLAEIVDPTTIEQLNRAQRSQDPTRRAAVARLTREAVAKRLAQLRDKRKQAEDRAASLRRGR